MTLEGFLRQIQVFPRSLTGLGNRETLQVIGSRIPALVMRHWVSGERKSDWTIPPEWNVRDAYIESPDGRRIAHWKENFLHLVGYSEPVDLTLSLDELQNHLHSIPEMPDAIPYVTSYYKRTWGFCLSHNERQALVPGQYRVVIDSTLEPGVMDYADLLLQGDTADEVMFSTYICHPTMANNEASGITVTTALAEWLQEQPKTRYTYRFVFVPETIGAIAYLADNLEHLKKHVKAGFQITCVGDERAYSYLPSRRGMTLSDRVAKHILSNTDPSFIEYTWLDRGSDERQWCSPGADLPIASIMRSRYGTYPEYHTSRDLVGDVVTPAGLESSLSLLKKLVRALEENRTYESEIIGEPSLSGHGLWSTITTYDGQHYTSDLKLANDAFSYCDGTHDLLQIADLLGAPIAEVRRSIAPLIEHGFLQEKENPPG